MGGENVSLNSEQYQSTGAETLASLPSFEEHMAEQKVKSFAELSSDERPEGVRDERDYQEYLAEMAARNGEAKARDEKVFNSVREIKNPLDRGLVAAMVPAFYNANALDDEGGREVSNVIGGQIIEKAAEYMNGDKSAGLWATLAQFWDETYKKYGNGKEARTFANFMRDDDSQLGRLMDGYLIAKEAEDEGDLEIDLYGNADYRFRDEFFDSATKVVGDGKQPAENRLIIRKMAREIACGTSEEDSKRARAERYAKLSRLENFFSGMSLERQLKRSVRELTRNVNKEIDRVGYENASVGVELSGITGVMVGQELIDQFGHNRDCYEEFLEKAKAGEAILDGANWEETWF